MEPLLLLVVLPLVVALALFTLLRRRGRKPVMSGCVALAVGVLLTLILAAVETLRAIF
jgi:hypothetical protein